MCMEIDKAEPDPSMKYVIAAPADQRMYDLAR